MRKKRGAKKMSTAATKIYNFSSRNKNLQSNSKTYFKAAKKMSQESIKSSYDFKRKSWERD